MFAQALDKMKPSQINELHTDNVYEDFHGILNHSNFTGVSGQINWFDRWENEPKFSKILLGQVGKFVTQLPPSALYISNEHTALWFGANLALGFTKAKPP